jgi:predicted kinase
VPRLILLNGPPAIGKSTLARRYVEEHPLALDLDIDLVRRQIGAWRTDLRSAGLLARAIALAAAGTHLAAGHDVVVPQLVAEPGFLRQLDELAASAGARFHEIVLLDGKENCLRRFAERSRAAAEPSHVEAAETADPERLAALYDRLVAVLAERPGARVIPATEGELAQTYARLLACL